MFFRSTRPPTSSRHQIFSFIAISAMTLTGSALFLPPSALTKRLDSPRSGPTSDSRSRLNRAYGQLPLAFEENRGQSDRRVKYLARGHGYTLFLTNDAASLRLSAGDRRQKPAVLRLKLLAANQAPMVTAEDELPGRRHYFIGSDPQRWRRDVGSFRQVRYSAVYPGIDLVFYGTQGELEYDFVIAPGADPRRIAFTFAGQDRLQLDPSSGDLLIKIGDEEIRQRCPFIYQEIDGQRGEVRGRYRLRGDKVGIEVDRYDQRKPLIIDPVLVYSTYLGGTTVERVQDIAVDSAGNAYATGFTSSTDFPGSSPIQSGNVGGVEDAYVVKLNPTGTAIVYGTYLGGQSTDAGTSIAVDGAGNAYVTGNTASTNFPTRNPLQAQLKGSADAFIAKINAAGSELIYSTYLGGTAGETATSIAIDNTGNAYLTGRVDSFDFPTVNARQPNKSASSFYATSSNGATWTPSANGLLASTVSALAFDPTNSATIFAGTEIGVYKSANSGVSWTRLPFAAEVTQVRALAIDPSNPSTIYVGIPAGAYKSTDGGQTAVKLGGGLPEGSVNALVVDPTSPNIVYAGMSTFRVYKSTNGGALWAEASGNIGLRFATINALAINPAMPNILYAATDMGPFRTANGGIVWSAINNNFPTHEVALAPSNPKVVYTVGGPFTLDRIFQRSDDDGVSWTRLIYPTTSEITSIAIDPSDPYRLLLGSTNGIFRSVDGGLNWTEVTNNIGSSSLQAILIDPANPSTIYVGTQSAGDAFVAKLNPPGSALVFSTYLGGSGGDQGQGIAIDGAGNIYLAGTTASTNFPTANPRQSTNGGGNDAFITKLSADGQTLIYSSYYGGSGAEQATGIAINNVGDIFFTGTTGSNNLPTVNSFQPARAAADDAFVARLKADGSAYIFSTYLGGSLTDQAQAIALDSAENIYIAGSTTSTNFPLFEPQQSTQGSNGFTNDAFLARFNPTGTMLTYSTYFGGDGADFGYSVAVDARNNIYIAGQTSSLSFPLLNPLQAMRRGGIDGFVAQFAIQADLSITASAAPNPVFMNGRLTYQLRVQNGGPDEALNVRLTDTLPTGATFVEATASQGTCTGTGPLTCQLGNLSKGATATVTLVVTVPAAGNINNTASLTSDTADPNTANNSVTTPSRVTDKPSIFGRARLADGTPIQGATVTLGGAQNATTLTDSRGEYQFAELTAGGNYTVTASNMGYILRPANYSFNNLNADQRADFAGVLCHFALSTTSLSIPRAGGMGSVQLTATDVLCPWTAVSDVPWITLTSATGGTGNAQITFNVAPTTAARSGQLRIGGRQFTVFQEFDTCGAVTFRNARTITIPAIRIPGQVSVDLAAGDLNGDGVDDLALLTKLPISSLSILHGNRLGGFDPAFAVDLKLGSVLNPVSASAVTIADLNSDGRQDLIVSSSFDGGSISSLLNQGGGVFSQPLVIRIGGSARKIVARDLNNDQKTDLALISEFTSNVTILLGNGDGSFVSNGNFGDNGQSPAPATLATGDFNNDGKIDLVSGGQGALTLFLGDGMGRFGTFSRIVPSFPIYAFAAGDFNNDGRPDLAFSHAQQGNGNTMVILTGKGDGTFNQSPNIDIGGSATDIFAADMTGEGKQDLVIVNQLNRYVGVLVGNGDGTFRPTTFYSSIERTGSPVIGDFNDDGRLDLVTSDPANFVYPTEIRLSLLYGAPGGGLLAARDFPLPNNTQSIVSGDFNEDGRLDLAIGHIAGPGMLTLLDGNASGDFDSPRIINLPSNIELRDVIDINHDGHLDLLALDYSAATVTILLGNGRGGFPFSAFQSVSQPLSDIAIADFNRDGNLDLIAPAANNSLSIALGLGTGEFGAPVVFATSIFNHRYAAGDFNGDGRMDLATTTGGFCNPNNEISIFYGDGLGGFPNKTRFATGTFQPELMLARDFNGDGRAELLTNNSCTPNQLLIFPTDEMGRLLEPATYMLENSIYRLRTADLNSDGRLDILAIQNSTLSNGVSTITALYSKSTGGFTNPAQIATGSTMPNLATGDFNRDGRNDIAFSNSYGNLTLLLNSCQAAGQFTSVSAANFSGPRLARDSIAAGFGNNLSTATAVASTVPLPTQLAGASVRVVDNAGSIHPAPLFFVSPNQINYLIPAAASTGPAVIQVIQNDQAIASETIQITNGSPALFSVTQDGQGFAAAQVLRVRSDGSQSYEPIVQFDPVQNAFVPVPIDLGPTTDQVYLLLFGTGFRNAPANSAMVGTSVAGLSLQYIGPQGSFVGLDQVNVLLPRFLIGSGENNISLQTELGQSNIVKLRIK